MPPQLFITIAAIAGLVFLIQWLQQNKKEQKNASEEAAHLKALEQQLNETQAQLDEFQKRLRNVEDIVTDSKFVDPPLTGREAIDLQAEIRALKDKLNRL